MSEEEIVVVAPRLRPSPTCPLLVKHWEKCRLKAYLPTPDDRPTIGWGMTFLPSGKPVRMGMEITQAEADEWFSDELAKRAARMAARLGTSPTTQPQFDALVSWFYNVGEQGLTSSLLKFHLAGHYEAAHAQFSLWIYQNRKRLNGLIKRRAMEGALYMTPEGRDPPWLIRLPTGFQVKEPRL